MRQSPSTPSSAAVRKLKASSSGGVGFMARGNSLVSRASRGVGLLSKTWGNFLVRRVVVVTVLVSTHSLTSKCKRPGCSELDSEILTETSCDGFDSCSVLVAGLSLEGAMALEEEKDDPRVASVGRRRRERRDAPSSVEVVEVV